jgi:hypothetical protein
MGADYIVIRGCRLQARLGAGPFAQTVKQRAQLLAIESRRTEIEQRVGRPLEELRITFGGTGEPEGGITLSELRGKAHALDDTTQCPGCPVGEGRPLGCYGYVTYPVSAVVERYWFDYFVDALQSGSSVYVVGHGRDGRPYSAASLAYELVLSAHAPTGTRWHLQRGSAVPGALAELAEPLRVMLASGSALDSAQVLGAVFAPAIDGAPALTLYAHLFAGFVDFLDRNGISLRGAGGVREVAEIGALLTAAARAAKSEDITVIVWS